MSVVLGVLGLLGLLATIATLSAAAREVLRSAWSASWIVRAARLREETPLSSLDGKGPVETRGTLAVEEPRVLGGDVRCFAVKAHLTEHYRVRGKKGSTEHADTRTHVLLASKASLVGDGVRVALDLDGMVFAGESLRETMPTADFRARHPLLAGRLARPDSYQVTVDAEFLREGAEVVVWAARLEGRLRGGGAYREESSPATLVGDLGRGIVVAPPSEVKLVARALPPALVQLLIGGVMAAYAAYLLVQVFVTRLW